jgi:hypothetical protein
MSASSSRATRVAEIVWVSETLARAVVDHDQDAKAPAIVRQSEAKSSDQRWFFRAGRVAGACVPVGRLRPRCRRTARPSSQ